MKRRDVLRSGAVLAATIAAPRLAFAQGYPSAPVTIILPLQAASASDVAVRRLAERMGNRFGVSFVVENVAAAAGVVGLERLSRARPDGQTIAALNNSIVTILPHLKPDHVKIDTRTEFLPIAGIANIPTFFAVPRSSSIQSIKDLLDQARKAPEKLTYASGGVGSPQHLAAEMLLASTGIKLVHVPYRGATQAAVATAAEEVNLMPMALSLAQPFLADGRVRLIAYCGSERHPRFKDIPTVAEEGVANYNYSSWIGLFLHKDAPPEILKTLRKEVYALVSDRDFQDQMTKVGMDPWPHNAEELSRIVLSDYDKWRKIISDANIPTT